MDITAIYVLDGPKIDFASAEASEIILKAMRRATREALLMHKSKGNSIAVSRDGEVVILSADEIVIPVEGADD